MNLPPRPTMPKILELPVFMLNDDEFDDLRLIRDQWRSDWMNYVDCVEAQVKPLRVVPVEIGELCYSKTLSGDIRLGTLKEWDNGTAILLIDGKEVGV